MNEPTLAFIEKTLREAAEEIARVRPTAKITTKTSPRDLVTDADKASEHIIAERIRAVYPEHAIIGEESGSDGKTSQYTWYIDPIDGTLNFTQHNPWWGIMIAVTKDDEPFLCGVFLPEIGDLFLSDGVTSFRNGERIHGSAADSLDYTIGTGYVGGVEKVLRLSRIIELGKKATFYNTGCASADIALLATGRRDWAFVENARRWDILPMAILARGAGLTVSDYAGNPWTIQSMDIVISAPKIHSLVLSAMPRPT